MVLDPATKELDAPRSATKVPTVIELPPEVSVIGEPGIEIENPLVPSPVTVNTAVFCNVLPVGLCGWTYCYRWCELAIR